MKDLKHISTIYFVGIGGIGMSALARYVALLGKRVMGYDKTPTALTSELLEEGIEITFTDSISELNLNILKPDNTLVVYTPAIPESNKILRFFSAENYRVIKRAALLGEVTRDTLCLAVAGTHGKTTTSAILGHLLMECDMPVTAFLGGIAENYQSNFMSKGTEITVVEADEFDRSFLQLQPDIACVTTMDADHLDIYGDASGFEESFQEFARLVPKKENLLIQKGLPMEGRTVAVDEPADFQAHNITIEDGAYVFDLKTPTQDLKGLRFSLPGHHNLFNAITALGMAISAGTPTPCLSKALFSFKGVQRRFSYKIRRPDLVLIDDYAHHPTELNALHQAVSEMYPDEQKLIVFQPHLFSRTRDFALGFVDSLSRFDEVLLLDIYPARELPIEGITSQWLSDQIEGRGSRVILKSEMAKCMRKSPCRIQLLVGAGDIGAEVEKVTKKLKDES
ncbi:MAG: Mur ligase domain-containing protein [Bacteroidota bacterium]